jgi:hypothetical protein
MILIFIATLTLHAAVRLPHVPDIQLNPKTDTLSWEYTSVKNLANGDLINVSGRFVTYGSKQIEWIQVGGEKIVFLVESTDGVWVDVQQSGTMSYGIKLNLANGNVKVERNNGGLQLALHLDKTHTLPTDYIFTITSVKKSTN